MEGSTVCWPSGVMTTACWAAPLGAVMVVISVTVPETPEWMSAETKPPALPTTVPTYTWSPLATAGAAGAPMCCPMDRTILDGRGIATVSRLEVPFSWGTPAPCAERLEKIAHSDFNLPVLHSWDHICSLFRLAGGDSLFTGLVQPPSLPPQKHKIKWNLPRNCAHAQQNPTGLFRFEKGPVGVRTAPAPSLWTGRSALHYVHYHTPIFQKTQGQFLPGWGSFFQKGVFFHRKQPLPLRSAGQKGPGVRRHPGPCSSCSAAAAVVAAVVVAAAAAVVSAPAAAAAQDDDQQNDPQAASAAPAVIAAPHNEYLLIYELRGRLNAALNPILCGGTTKVCHRYFSAKFCSMTATWARVALSSGLRSIRSASELDSRPAPTAQATASPPQLATAAASS